MNQEQLFGTLRTILAAGGGYLIGKGYIDAEMWAAVSGAVLALAMLAWSWYVHTHTQTLVAAAAIPKVQKIITADQATADKVPSTKVVSSASQR